MEQEEFPIAINLSVFTESNSKTRRSLMKVVILAGGFGTRISEETHLKPKPMIEIGDKPILWHIMKLYSSYGFNEFIICLGYKGHVIKEYFSNYFLNNSDVTFNFENEPLENLARDGQFMEFKHTGFWQPMDTLKDKLYLQEIWESQKSPWKNWDQ